MFSKVSLVAPATSVDLTVLATLKAELGITDNSENEQLELWIDQASAACEAYCNRTFAQQTYRQVFRNRDSICLPSIVLAHHPVTAIASVTLDGTVLTVDDDYEWEESTGTLYRLSAGDLTDWNFTTLDVQFTAGYVLIGELPMNIEKACLALAKVLRFNAQRDPSIQSVSIPGVIDTRYALPPRPGVSDTTTGNIPPDVAGLLDPYREITV
jgi:hypothetical protein